MASAYELKTEQFTGPIEKLLELIEAKELDITTIGLSAVTADFLNYVEKLAKEAAEVNPQLLADFIVVAARLLLIKSKTLLPQTELTPEEEADIKDLESRLRLYKEFKAAAKNLDVLWKRGGSAFGREFLSSYGGAVFYPSPKLTPKAISQILASLIAVLQETQLREKKFVQKAIISIEQKMKELIRHLSSVTSSSFFELAPRERKEEIVALFLAMLHLVRDRLIDIEQSGHFSDIIIKPKNTI